MKIIAIDEKSPYLEAVIELAQANASTLGFLPRGAFLNQAANRQIFVAIDENEDILGYLLYGINRKDLLAYITHLCVDQSKRNTGIARALFNELKETTKDTFRGIRVRCRRDYEATNLWPKLGFHAVGDIPGRSKHGTTLTVWWFDHGHPTLFTYAAQKQTESKLKVVIDANVFYELDEPPTSANELSHALNADWLDITLCLTNEIFTEIHRKDDETARERAWAIAHGRFPTLPSPNDEVQRISENLRDLFPTEMSESDGSDLRQIAKTIASGVQFFVTRDGELLKISEDVYDRYGVRIIRPSDLIIHQDALIRETEYQPSRLSGSLIPIQRVHSQKSDFLENNFLEQGETKKAFRRILQPYLADPRTFEVKIVMSEEQPLALIIYSRQNEDILDIPVLRIVQNSLSPTLARHLVLNTILTSSNEKRTLTTVSAARLSDDFNEALQENGFVFTNQVWVKANLHLVEQATTLGDRLTSLSKQFPQVEQYFQQLLTVLNNARNENNFQALLQVERLLWPAKIADLDIPTYIVAIWPEWAKDLFDPNIAEQTLFGADPNLMFRVENVYYRTSHTKLDAPARILWYVSRHKGKFQGTMAIRACSYLDEVVVGKPKELFSRFKRLGVYRWEDVYGIAKQNIEQEIMAFRFSSTELLSNPIHWDDLQKIWIKEKGKKFNILSPVAISNDTFLYLYKIGSQIQG